MEKTYIISKNMKSVIILTPQKYEPHMEELVELWRAFWGATKGSPLRKFVFVSMKFASLSLKYSSPDIEPSLRTSPNGETMEDLARDWSDMSYQTTLLELPQKWHSIAYIICSIAWRRLREIISRGLI